MFDILLGFFPVFLPIVPLPGVMKEVRFVDSVMGSKTALHFAASNGQAVRILSSLLNSRDQLIYKN